MLCGLADFTRGLQCADRRDEMQKDFVSMDHALKDEVERGVELLPPTRGPCLVHQSRTWILVDPLSRTCLSRHNDLFSESRA